MSIQMSEMLIKLPRSITSVSVIRGDTMNVHQVVHRLIIYGVRLITISASENEQE